MAGFVRVATIEEFGEHPVKVIEAIDRGRSRQVPDAERCSARTAFPCVVKPLTLSASRGVIRADDEAQFVGAVRRLENILRTPEAAAADGDAARQLLVEGFIPGREVALEGLLLRGKLHVLALFDKPDPLDGPFFEETIYVTPSRLPSTVQAQIAACTARAAHALGLRDGPVHAELRVNRLGPWVIEVAARSIGGLCSRTLRFGTGLSLEELILRQALGMGIPSFERERRAVGVMMIPIPRAGVLKEIRGQAEAQAVPGIDEVAITAHPGQDLIPLPEGARATPGSSLPALSRPSASRPRSGRPIAGSSSSSSRGEHRATPSSLYRQMFLDPVLIGLPRQPQQQRRWDSEGQLRHGQSYH
jgi:biotin carboxylase